MTQQMSSELGALTELGLREIGTATVGIHKVQRAISERVFFLVGLGVGPAAKPVKRIYDTITDGVYSLIGDSATAAAPAIGMAVDSQVSPDSRLSENARGAGVLAALQGLIGDRLHEQGSALATGMSIRVDGRPVAPEPGALRAAFPGATVDLVVFLHGLVETERFWGRGGGLTYGERLSTDLGVTSVQLRYNTGLHISENGRLLADLLDELVQAWPVPVRSLSLVGHSMGGLVIRSACAAEGTTGGKSWIPLVRNIITLGTPHTGAPLEKLVHFGSAALNVLPETRPFGRLLRRRSTGIRDLRFGSLHDSDWRDHDRDSLRAAPQTDVPLLDGVSYYCVSAAVTSSPINPVGWVVGDGLVQVPSALGRSRMRRIGFPEENRMHITKAHHFTLLNDDTVYQQIRKWLS